MDDREKIQEQIQMLGKKFMEMQSELLATQIAIRSLLLTHPDRDHAIETATAELLRWEATGLNSDVPDEALAGFDRARGRVFPSEQDLQRIP